MRLHKLAFFAVVVLSYMLELGARAETFHVDWIKTYGDIDKHSSHPKITTGSDGSVYVNRYEGFYVPDVLPYEAVSQTILTKYNASGEEIWTRRSELGESNTVNAMLTGSDGALYQLESRVKALPPGSSYLRSSYTALSKYSSDGEAIWSRQIGANGSVQGISMAINDNSIYVAGSDLGSLGGPNRGNQDAFVSKLTSDGDELWSRKVASPSFDRASSVAVDASGYVYLAGRVGRESASELPDGFLAKYAPEGNQVWLQRTRRDIEEAYDAVVISPEGELSTVYRTVGQGVYGYLQSHSTLTGQVESSKLLAEDASALAYDAQGNLYRSGLEDGTSLKAMVRKYSQTNELLWEYGYGANDLNWLDRMAVGADGALYFSGTESDSQKSTTFVIRLSSVPEPTAALLVAVALAPFARDRRSRQR